MSKVFDIADGMYGKIRDNNLIIIDKNHKFSHPIVVKEIKIEEIGLVKLKSVKNIRKQYDRGTLNLLEGCTNRVLLEIRFKNYEDSFDAYKNIIKNILDHIRMNEVEL
jgi:hypothetical protein